MVHTSPASQSESMQCLKLESTVYQNEEEVTKLTGIPSVPITRNVNMNKIMLNTTV